MNGRHVLVLATSFTPSTAGVDVVGTIRPQLWTRFLPESGWSPIVVTGGPQHRLHLGEDLVVRYVPADSVIANAKALGGVSIATEHRAAGVIQEPLSSLRLGVLRLGREVGSLAPDTLAWAMRAARAGIALARRHQIEVVFSTSPSPAAHLAAWLVAVECGLPWVAELRDLWAQRPTGAGTPRMRRLPDALIERLLFRRAAALVTVSDGLAERLRAVHRHLPVHAIRTGFDPDLLAPKGTTLADDFRLVYAGRIAGRQNATGVLRPLASAIASGRIERSRTRVELLTMGTLSRSDREFISAQGLDDVVVQEDLIPRDEVIRRERRAQILLHFRWDDPRQPGILTGKLFEYLAAMRPILSTGAFPDEVSEVLASTGAGFASTSDRDTEHYLVEAFRSFQETGMALYGGHLPGLERFSARGSASRLAIVLDEAAS